MLFLGFREGVDDGDGYADLQSATTGETTRVDSLHEFAGTTSTGVLISTRTSPNGSRGRMLVRQFHAFRLGRAVG